MGARALAPAYSQSKALGISGAGRVAKPLFNFIFNFHAHQGEAQCLRRHPILNKKKRRWPSNSRPSLCGCRYDDISREARQQLKIHVLDAIGCAIGALEAPPVKALRAQLEEFGGNPLASLIGGGKTSPVLAAFYNSTLERYLDFMDSFVAKHETCHPADNVMSVLAASEYAGKSGKDFLTAVAVAYQVQCRLSEVAPVRPKGFDHTVQGAYAVAAGVAQGAWSG